MNEKLWEECVDFHGHACPGLAMGFRASEIAAEELGIPLEKASDEEIVCIVENDACGVDAVQVLFSCTAGKGNLLFRIRGKQVFSFFDRNTGKKVRVIMDVNSNFSEREESMYHILNASRNEISKVMEPSYEVPEKARIFNSVVCEICKEAAREDLIRLQEEKKVCLDCFNDYTRNYF